MKALLFYCTLLCLLWGCGTRKSETNKPISATKAMKEIRVDEQQGMVDYREDLQKFIITYHQKETIDGQITCLPAQNEMIPRDLQKPGIRVVFSGLLAEDPTLPPPRMGGEQVLLLKELDSMHLYNKN